MASQAIKITLERIALFQFTPAHCAQARAMLDWSIEELSRESGVSAEAIQRFENQQPVLDVTRLALAYRFESEGLAFFPGFVDSGKPAARLRTTRLPRDKVASG